MVVFKGITPLFYIIFIIFYSPKENNSLFLVLSFLLGFGLDILTNTPGVNSFSCVLLAYLRQFVLPIIDRNSYFEINFFSFSNFNLLQNCIYIFLMSFIHHFALFFVEAMKISLFLSVLLNSLLASFLTSLFVFIYSNFKNHH
jgi:rod shape-determining protein MreD